MRTDVVEYALRSWDVTATNLTLKVAVALHGDVGTRDVTVESFKVLRAAIDHGVHNAIRKQWAREMEAASSASADAAVDLETVCERAVAGCMYAASKFVLAYVARRCRPIYHGVQNCPACGSAPRPAPSPSPVAERMADRDCDALGDADVHSFYVGSKTADGAVVDAGEK